MVTSRYGILAAIGLQADFFSSPSQELSAFLLFLPSLHLSPHLPYRIDSSPYLLGLRLVSLLSPCSPPSSASPYSSSRNALPFSLPLYPLSQSPPPGSAFPLRSAKSVFLRRHFRAYSFENQLSSIALWSSLRVSSSTYLVAS